MTHVLRKLPLVYAVRHHPGARLALPPRASGCISSRARKVRSNSLRSTVTACSASSERDWEPPQPRFTHDQIVAFQVVFADVAVRTLVKQAGGTWNPDRKVWQLRYDRVVALGLGGRILDAPRIQIVDARGRGERISMQMPRRHPDRHARIHGGMPASRAR